MVDPNSFIIARAIHERRIIEATRQHRHHPRRAAHAGLLNRLTLGLGNYLIRIGAKLKTLAPVSPSAYDPQASRVGR